MHSANVLNRMGHVLFALGQAANARELPMRIQLQKFIYLTDVLAQIVGALQPADAHETYHNGPYDPAIQNAVDCLAFRGFVRVADVWRTPQGKLATRYALTGPGSELLGRLHDHGAFRRHVEVAELVGEHLKRLGWNRIVDLVYSEPTFVAARPEGYGSALAVENGLDVSAAYLIAVMRRVAMTVNPQTSASPGWIADRFFAYLDHYDRNHRKRAEADATIA